MKQLYNVEKTARNYALANSIRGIVKQNPLPAATSEQAQTDTFADYFLQKIVNIRVTLKEYDSYWPSGKSAGQLSKFQPVTGEDVRKIIASLPTESCEFDEIPTKYLKQWLNEYTWISR